MNTGNKGMNNKYLIEWKGHLGDWSVWEYFRDFEKAKEELEILRANHPSVPFRLIRYEREIIG